MLNNRNHIPCRAAHLLHLYSATAAFNLSATQPKVQTGPVKNWTVKNYVCPFQSICEDDDDDDNEEEDDVDDGNPAERSVTMCMLCL